MLRFMELAMKFRPVYWLFVLGTPFVVSGALVLGRRFDANLGGILLQVCGGFVGLSWTTWMFLELGQALTRLFGSSPNESAATADEPAGTPQPTPGRPPLRRAA